MLQVTKRKTLSNSVAGRSAETALTSPRNWRCRMGGNSAARIAEQTELPPPETFGGYNLESIEPVPISTAQEIDPLYLLACQAEWECSEEPNAGWELISAAQSSNSDTRANARALLANSRHLGGFGLRAIAEVTSNRLPSTFAEEAMKTPYDIEIVDRCVGCTYSKEGFFCDLPYPVLRSIDKGSHKSTLPAGAILFVEGQAPRGMFIICEGRVNLSTTSREGKILILKTASAGEVLGLSATISGMGYEITAETATPCQLCFIDSKHFYELLLNHSEMGVHSAHCLSRDYQSAYRDIHDLVLTRSSAGKLARLLLSQTPEEETENESRIQSGMTHEEMAQRIGASRETVTRLLSHLRKKQLIRLDGATLVIRDRNGLEALTT